LTTSVLDRCADRFWAWLFDPCWPVGSNRCAAVR
jgi:hypothetical protein